MNDTQKKPLYIGAIILTILKYLVLIAACLLVLIPIASVILGSLKSRNEFYTTSVFKFPETPIWENYKVALTQVDMGVAFVNTAIIIVISCAGSILTGTMTAYVVQRFNTAITRTVKVAFLIATLFPNITMNVTIFLIMAKLHLTGTIIAPIILSVGTDIVSIYIFIQFLSQISTSLDESAIIDGASYLRIYFSIILPNLLPAIATVLILKFVGIYNDFYTAKLYMADDQFVISTLLLKLDQATDIKLFYGSSVIFAGVVICIIPTLVIFLFLQKYIYSGLVSGSVKE